MASLPLAVVLQLAAAHAPQVAPETIATFAQAESALNPHAVYDNTARRSYAPRTAADASRIAADLLAQGHSIDTGLMQINSRNFRLVGLDHITAFDPAQSVRAAQIILIEAYSRCAERRLTDDPLRCMASIYNTGNHTRGERNGYVERIYKAAEVLVPAIRKAVGEQAPSPAPAQSPAAPPHGCGPPPPSWDGFARTAHQRCITNSHLTRKPEKTEP